MTYGIQNADVVDFVAYLPSSGEVALVMIEERRWDVSRERLLEIQAKAHNYVSFALDGQLAKGYPEYAGKPVSIELHCFEPPPDAITEFLKNLNQRLTRYDIKIRVVVVTAGRKAAPIRMQRRSWLEELISSFARWYANLRRK